jgi:molecular chaperone DnaK
MNQEEIDAQQNLLATHRRTLSVLLQQQAQHTLAYAPPGTINSIMEARDNIRRIKEMLRDWGVAVQDHPNDEDVQESNMSAGGPSVRDRFQRAKIILILAANPQSRYRLHLDNEIREIQEKLQQYNKVEEFIVYKRWAVSYRDVQQAILECNPHIVHFSGYGTGDQGILLEDLNGQTKFVSAKALADLFKLFPAVKCVLLNACYKEVQAEAIAQRVDYVVGLRQSVGDKAAIEFAVGFYDALGAGKSIEYAYQFGRTAIRMADIPEELMPVLETRKDLRLLRSESEETESVTAPIDQSEQILYDREPTIPQPSPIQPPPLDVSSRMASLLYWLEDTLAGGAEPRLRRAISRLESIFGESTSNVIDHERSATEYGKTMRLAMRINPSTAVQLMQIYDSQISDDHYGRAFVETDSKWIMRQIKRRDENILKVCLKLATRMELQSEYSQTADLLATYYVDKREDSKLIAHLNLCLDSDFLSRDFLSGCLEKFVARGGDFNKERQAWEGLLNRVYIVFSKIPEIFEVHLFLNSLTDAYRLATASNQKRVLLNSCLQAQIYEDICLGIKVAEELHDAEAIKRAHELAGDNRFSGGEYEIALRHFIASECLTKVSECYERLNQTFEALQTCPSLQQHRLVALVDRCLHNDFVKLHEFSKALLRLNQIADKLKTVGEPSREVQARVMVVVGHRQEILKVIRQHYSRMIETLPVEYQQIYQEWSQLEYTAGEYEEAARLAEKAGDYDDAYRFFLLIGQCGEAVRVMSLKYQMVTDSSNTLNEEVPDSPARIAEANEEKARIHANTARAFEVGGQPEAAAPLWGAIGKLVDARRCYEEAGDWAKAVYCLFQEFGDEKAIESDEFDQLVKKANLPIKEFILPCVHAVKLKGRQTRAAQLLDHLLKQKAVEELPIDVLNDARATMEALRLEDRRNFNQKFPVWLKVAREEIDSRYASIWGLDLGTTKCCAAIYDSQLGRPIICKWKNEDQFPSTLCLDRKGMEHIGLRSDELFSPHIVGRITASKRKMGSGHVYLVGKERYRPEEIAARLIAHARMIVENFLTQELMERIRALANREFNEFPHQWLDEAAKYHEITLSRPKVLVTIPAFFRNNQKQSTQDACIIAGVELIRLLHEPTAACVAASLTRGLSGRVIVVDLGAGTLDISEMEAEGGVYEVIQVYGNNNFGGKDFDSAIATRVVTKLSKENSIEIPMGSLMMERLEVASESLKIELSSVKTASYTLHGFGSIPHVQLELSQSELEGALAQPLRILHRICEEFKSGLQKKADYLLIVGGPMLSPLIQKHVEEIFNLKATIVGDTRTIVARGAALQAGVLAGKLEETILLDVVPFRLGIKVVAEDKDKGSNLDPVIQKNATIPTRQTKDYTTAKDNQTAVDIEIFQGELIDQSKIGHFRLGGIVAAPKGTPKIEVTFSIDSNCVLTVTAKDKGTGQSKSIAISDTTLLSPIERDELATRFQEQKERHDKLQELTDTLNELETMGERAKKIDVEDIRKQWRAHLDVYQPSIGVLESRTEQMLFEMFNQGHEVERELILAEVSRRDIEKNVAHFIASTREKLQATPSLDEIVGIMGESRDLQSQLENCIDQLQSIWNRLSEWHALLVRLATGQVDPLKRFVACHNEKRYGEAVAAFKQIDSQQATIANTMRYLDCLGHLGDKEIYHREIVNYGEELGIRVIDPTMLDQYCTEVFPSVALIQVESDDQIKQGTGFLASDRLVVTSRSVLVNAENNDWDEEQTQKLRIYLAHAWQTVDRVIFPASSRIDLALIRLVEPLEVRAFRLGYSNLIRLGQSVTTLGYKIANPAQQPIETASVYSGIINEYEAIADLNIGVFKVGFQLAPGLIGAPLINDLGEVVGMISTIAEFKPSREHKDESFQSSGVSFALAVNGLRELIQEHLVPSWYQK